MPSPTAASPLLRATDLTLSYRSGSPVVRDVALSLQAGRVTALIGPNGSGKSTVLRSLARLHRLDAGLVELGTSGTEQDASLLSAREFARRITLLSQSRPHPSGLAVRDVVAFGRHPHRGRFSPLRDADRAAINKALDVTGTTPMADRSVEELSGGELQRVWLATCLAQETAIVLLDEPTNHLDLRFQVEILDLIRELADDHDAAIGVVLHDLGHAAIVADDLVLLHRGRVRAAGSPDDVLQDDLLSEVYGVPIRTSRDDGIIRVDAIGRHRRRPTG